ncbi:hypothetical protein BDF21DRAFT_3162 [Thamnidium elegans]|uniref:Uncharacterized protein n=1 Tax=Thamnidium elegans TaxID=101142 RepID=A0A8H7ST18_9FUNG|nr:hypothetical protein INT48_001861 [Thamnidium elegans]KAI8095273.1 hypothetical protein BDF21DRAFT_3162 [Thamnidium elegans]
MDLKTLQRLTNLDNIPSPVHLRAIIPNNFSSCLVGHGAAKRKELSFTCQTNLHVCTVPGIKWGQVVTTKGQPEPLSRAWYKCAKQLIENYPEFYQRFGLRIDFIFPSDLIEMFLSTDQFKRIARESDTSILVKRECLMRSTERMVRINTRNLEEQSLLAFKTAVHLLATVVQENITMAMCSPGNVFYTQELQDNLWSYTKEDLKNDILFTPVQTN